MQKKIHLTEGNIYFISGIDPQCEWYSSKQDFEGRKMRCVETFNTENAAGFCFENQDDCPKYYDSDKLFCFSNVQVREIEIELLSLDKLFSELCSIC